MVVPTIEGTRPILLEVQALVDPSHLNNPRRVALGLEHNRLAMMLAVPLLVCIKLAAEESGLLSPWLKLVETRA